MPSLTEYGDIMLNGYVDEWGRRRINGLLEDGVKILAVVGAPIMKTWGAVLKTVYFSSTPFRVVKLTQNLNMSHLFTRPFRSFKLTQTLNLAHMFRRPFRTMKFTQSLNSIHVFLRHKTFKLTQTLKTLGEWTLPVLAFLKQWFATLQTTHMFRLPYRSMKLMQALNLTHVFRRPFRFIKLIQNVNPTHVLRINKLLKFISQILKPLHNWIKRVFGGFPFKIEVEENKTVNVMVEEHKTVNVTTQEYKPIQIVVEERTE